MMYTVCFYATGFHLMNMSQNKCTSSTSEHHYLYRNIVSQTYHDAQIQYRNCKFLANDLPSMTWKHFMNFGDSAGNYAGNRSQRILWLTDPKWLILILPAYSTLISYSVEQRSCKLFYASSLHSLKFSTIFYKVRPQCHKPQCIRFRETQVQSLLSQGTRLTFSIR